MPARRGRTGRDEYISRPRFLAISEFGPRALIYHEGARYRVYKVNLDFGSDAIEDTRHLATQTMKRCSRCGYAHLEAGGPNFAEMCDRCGAALDAASRIDGLVQLQNVSLRLAQRITCDEEERQRFGYDLVTAWRFPEVDGRLDFFYRDAAAAIYIDGPPHDSPHHVREDDATTETLIGMGYIVIRFHHQDDWLAIFRRHADVFGMATE